MGHVLSIAPAGTEENRKLAEEMITLAKRWPNGFQTNCRISQANWVMENSKGAVFEIEEFAEIPLLEEFNEAECSGPLQIEGIKDPEVMFFIAPDEASLVRLVEEQ